MKRIMSTALLGVSLMLAASSCANPTDEAEAPQAGSEGLVAEIEPDDEIAAMVPEKYQTEGEFTASINPDVAPIKFVNSDGDITGLNPELLRAAARTMDLEVVFEEGTFDAMVPGLEAKRYDIIASVGDFVERQEKIDFIDYLKSGTAILATADLPQDEVTIDELCGLSVGYTRGNAQQTYLEDAAKTCAKNGQPKPKINAYDDSGAGVLSVKSGEADAFWGDTPQMNYNAEQAPDLYKVIYNEVNIVYGIGVRKDNAEFRDALRAALLKLVEDGVYDDLLEQWAQSEYAEPTMPMNSDISEAG